MCQGQGRRSATGSARRDARNSGIPAVFWLDPYRPHEHELIQKVVKYVRN